LGGLKEREKAHKKILDKKGEPSRVHIIEECSQQAHSIMGDHPLSDGFNERVTGIKLRYRLGGPGGKN